MGFEDLPAHVRKRLGRKTRKRHASAKDTRATAQRWREPLDVKLWMPCDPPTYTHHAKVLGRNFASGKANIRDSDHLRAAKTMIGLLVPANTGAAVAPPVELSIRARFRVEEPMDPAVQWLTEKPDCDNLSKLIVDALAKAGWLIDDKHVSREIIEKVAIGPGGVPGIEITLRTMTQAPAVTYTYLGEVPPQGNLERSLGVPLRWIRFGRKAIGPDSGRNE